MLSVSTIKSASKAGGYYTAEDNYYFLGEQATGWYGTGAESLGLEGPVSREMFTEILEGRLPDGTDLTRMEGDVNRHRPGYDLTFSAPKSVSVLALVTGDRFLVEAHNRAVERTLDEVEKLATTRTMQDGVSGMERTGNLVIARFLHDTSRNLDPQLHTHAVVANVTLAEGGWKTLSSDTKNRQGFTDQVWSEQVSLGTLYRAFLRQDIEAAGYPVTTTGERGEWDITGVPVKEFSSRRQDILDVVGTDASARQKSVAALDTRNKKEFSDMESVREHWKKTLEDTGFDPATLRDTVAGTTRQLQTEPAPQGLTEGREKQARDGQPFRSTVPERPDMAAEVSAAVARLSAKNVRFTYDNVLTSVLTHVPVENGVLLSVRVAIDDAISRGALLAVDTKQTLFTSAAQLRDEKRLAEVAGGLAEKSGGLLSPSTERGAMAQLAEANRLVTLVDVRGGQSYMKQFSESVVALAEKNDRPLVVVAADSGSLKRQKTLFDTSRRVTLTTAAELADTPLPDNALVLVSEAERFSTTSMHDVLKTSGQQGGTVVVADTHARRTTGFATEVLKASGVKSVTASAAGDAVSVTLVQKDTVDDRMEVAARYYAQKAGLGEVVTAQAGNRQVRAQLTSKIRDVMKEEGTLGRILSQVTVREPVWLDATSRNDRSVYREGMVLEHHLAPGVKEDFTITGVSEKQNRLTLTNEKGQTLGLKISAIDSHYRLYREKTLEVREGEQLRASADIDVRAGAGERLTVTGLKQGKWLFKDKLVMSNSRGQTVYVNPDAPLYADYGYTESFGATRRAQGSVIAVLSGRDVSDATVNMLKRSGDNVTAFTSLDEHTMTKRLEENRPLVTITGSLKSLSGQDDLTEALRTLGARKMSLNEREVRLAIEKVTGTRVTFSETAVRAEIATDNVMLAENLSLHMGLLQKRGEIIPLSPEQGAAGLFISRDNFDNELTILRHMAEGKNAVSPLVTGGLTAEQSGGLTDGQRQAADLILTSRDRIIGIQGYAGVGKTTQFRTVAAAVSEMDNPPVIAGLAPTHRAVSELNGAGIPAQTIASFLSENSQWQEAGEARDYSNTLFVIDESSMNGNAQMASLLTVIADGGGRAVLSGDRDQLKSLESGAPFALTLERSAADVAVMKEIVRQTPALRPAIEAIIAGNVKEALTVAAHVSPDVVPRQRGAAVPESSIVDVYALQVAAEKQAGEEGAKMGLPKDGMNEPRADIYSLVADDYAGRTQEARDNTLIITPLNSDRQRLNQMIHEVLAERGVLNRDESTVVQQLIRVGNSNADLGRRSFWAANRDNTVRIGERYYKVGESDQGSGIVRMHGLEGADDRWLSPPELRKESVAVFRPATTQISTGEKIRLTATDRERGITSSDMGTVTGVTRDGQITLNTGGRTLILNPNRSLADQHMDYGYAVTNYSSQGASVDYVIALASNGRMATLDNAYVQLSRTKEHVQVYAHNLQKWTKQVESNSGRRETVHDVVMRAEDNLADREVRLWERSQPVADTRLAMRTDSDLMADARFLSGKTPEIIWPVINPHGRQRGNWHVPVSPATGQVDFSQAHYEGAGDGSRIVLQRGDKHGKILEAEDVRQALALMEANPDSPVVLSAGRTGESESRAPETAAVSAGEELQVKDEEALQKAIRSTLGTEEKAERDEQRGNEENSALTDSAGGEKERHGLADIAERELEDSLLARYGQDKPEDAQHDRNFRSDEVNIVRHERVHSEPEPKPAPQKTLD